MKSALQVSFVACLLAVAAGCSSGEGNTDTQADPSNPSAPASEALAVPPTVTPAVTPAADSSEASPAALEAESASTLAARRSRRPRPQPAPTNPCAAVSCLTNTSCEVIDGQAVCVPIDAPSSGQFCGGFAGIACPGSGSCVDDPSDGCDPRRGGADCAGLCECNVRALCIRGLVFDPSPEVCACVPAEPAPDACAGVRCRAGTHCEVVGGDAATCAPDEPVNPCAAVLCPAPSSCDVVDGKAVCTPIEPSGPFCGGIAAIECPGAGSCVDNPGDGCNPSRGGADCGGVCECNVRALCIRGSVFDPSPEVCACVPAEPAPDACASVRCRAGTHCEVVGGDAATCAPDEPVNPCAAVLCAAPSSCEVVDGKAVCTPLDPPFCGGIAAFACPGSGSCVDNPADDCDPKRGGADCGGICECNVRALCIAGFAFDASPEVCACVPADGSGQQCLPDAR